MLLLLFGQLNFLLFHGRLCCLLLLGLLLFLGWFLLRLLLSWLLFDWIYVLGWTVSFLQEFKLTTGSALFGRRDLRE